MEITPQQIDAYVRHLRDREARLRAELVRVERSINRIQKKIAEPEKSLRSDLRERVAGVSQATGIPLTGSRKKVSPLSPPIKEDEKLDLPLDKGAQKYTQENLRPKKEGLFDGWFKDEE